MHPNIVPSKIEIGVFRIKVLKNSIQPDIRNLNILHTKKLDGVGPVDNRPSTD